ncbi:ABC transporter substrate-binding protein [Alloiococcus sp. CFN-8]|uniref:ABC transporter substrate-binding protein n=1 Tax=Alloiococcus sp. CFN-8 TaxID=3416081 RepID=UPI003CF70F44
MKRLKNITAIALSLIVPTVIAGCSQSGGKKDGTYTVGIVQLVEHNALDSATEGFQDALKEKLGDKVEFDFQNAQGEQTNAATIVTKFVNDGVDLIMANATNAVKAAREATSEIPIVGTSVTDYVESGLVASDEKPGENLTGASDNNPVEVQVELMGELAPEVKTVGIVYSSSEENSKIQADEAQAAFEAKGYTVKQYTAADSNELQSVVTAATAEVDAFYEPTDNLVASNMEIIKNVTVPAGKPVITGEQSMAEVGGLATYSIDYYDLGYEAGLMAHDILVNGKNPGEMPIFHFDTSNLKLYINEEIAGELGITIPDSLK